MDFAHYSDDPVGLAVDLVNTYDWTEQTEELATVSDVVGFVRAWSGTIDDDLPGAVPEDVPAVHNLRRRLRAVIEAPDAASAADVLNGILVDSGATPRLSTHGGAPHLHFEPADHSLAAWLGVVTAMGLATVVADAGVDRLGTCQAEGCGDAFVDGSRNRSRRHCSAACRNRENVAAHRERRREDAD